MPQAGRERVLNPMRSLNFFNLLNPSAALGSRVYTASDRNEYQKQRNNVSGQ
jgi:hypothetical protein